MSDLNIYYCHILLSLVNYTSHIVESCSSNYNVVMQPKPVGTLACNRCLRIMNSLDSNSCWTLFSLRTYMFQCAKFHQHLYARGARTVTTQFIFIRFLSLARRSHRSTELPASLRILCGLV
jgi:hypothetical protein